MELEVRNKSIERELCLLRRVLGITQSDFAAALGITKQTMSRIEGNKTDLSTDIGTRLYFALTELLEPPDIDLLDPVQLFAIKEFMPRLKQHIQKSGIYIQIAGR